MPAFPATLAFWEVPKKSVRVRVSFEEKETRVLAITLALAHTLALFQYPERELNTNKPKMQKLWGWLLVS